MKKATRIEYDPFNNRIMFQIAPSVSGPWRELGDSAELRQYLNRRVLFSNCASDIVRIVQTRQNISPEGLEIQFVGPDSDYDILEKVVREANAGGFGAGLLTCTQLGSYEDAASAICIIKSAYERIAGEFRDYLPGGAEYEAEGKLIGDKISQFEKTVSEAVPVCVIGNYSVGKSALVNALIGDDILPSKEDPTTAKNVEIVSSDRFAIGLELDDAAEPAGTLHVVLLVSAGAMTLSEQSDSANELLEYLTSVIQPAGKTEIEIIHLLLDALNAPVTDEDDQLLERVGWNVIVELPFANSLLSQSEDAIIFFDTPGSDNADLDFESHNKALTEFMGSQTNALPLLVTTRDQLVRKDNTEIRLMLDEYADNFATPSCLVVLAKCDVLNRSKLEEGIPASIKNWHGKSVILYTTAIGALGEKKGRDSDWLDGSYRDDFLQWEERERGSRKVSLPDFNVYPCKERQMLSKSAVPPKLYDTGIPSLEYEILHYVRNYSDYKKCARGKADLEEALSRVRELLENEEREAAESRRLAEKEKAKEKSSLVASLREIQLPGMHGIAEKIAPFFSKDLDRYCRSLPHTVDIFYAEASANDDPNQMDEEVNHRLREHCQMELIDTCYERMGGARDMIQDELVRQADDYAIELRRFVDQNDSHLTEAARKELRDYLGRELSTPSFTKVDSVLGDIVKAFEKAALFPHEVLKFVRRPEDARRSWVKNKAWWFEQRLRDHQVPFNEPARGLFFETLLARPIGQYYGQLETWADKFKVYIEGELDSGNAILSGMEADIERLDEKVSDLKGRLDRISDVEDKLSKVLQRKEPGDGEE